MIALTDSEWGAVCHLQAVASGAWKTMDRVAMGGVPNAEDTNRLMSAELDVFQVIHRVRRDGLAVPEPAASAVTIEIESGDARLLCAVCGAWHHITADDVVKTAARATRSHGVPVLCQHRDGRPDHVMGYIRGSAPATGSLALGDPQLTPEGTGS